MTTVLSSAGLLASAWDEPLRRLFLRSDQAGPGSRHTDDLFMWIFWFGVFWFVLLMALMVYWAIRYRRRPGVPPQRSSSHNTPLELAWTILPLIPLAYMFFAGFHGYMDKLVAPASSYEISITGLKWNWVAKYPNGAESAVRTVIGAEEIPVIVVPAGIPVKLRMHSLDVLHAFWIPDWRVKQDVLPNRYTSLWFTAEEPTAGSGARVARENDGTGLPAGTPYTDHWVFCAEYCGDKHSEMLAIIRVLPEPVFNAVIADWLGGDLTPVELGRRLYVSKGCNACHSLDGSRNIGPTWLGDGETGGYGATIPLADGSTAVIDENYFRESVLVPGAKIHAGYPNQMSSFQGLINDRELNALLMFYKSLSPKGRAEMETSGGQGG
jgi:cytochrome c oxidase subunit 2